MHFGAAKLISRRSLRMIPFRLFTIIFIALMFSWFIIQFVIVKTCFIKDDATSLSGTTCQKEKIMLLQNVMELSNDPRCIDVLLSVKTAISGEHRLPVIIVVTPTYARPVQKAELTHLCHTLLLVQRVLWIVVEDSANKTSLVRNFLAKCNVPSIHMNVLTPESLKNTAEDPSWLKPRGVLQRNHGLAWIREHVSNVTKAVVYFADDDNTYDLELFKEMRFTRKVSVWPVGLVGGLMVEKPLVKNSKVVGWNTVWKANRPFPIDMAGFAVNASLLLQHKNAAFSLRVPRGYQESHLLKAIVTVDQLEPKADNCTKVLVWHTRTEKPKLKQEIMLNIPSNVGIEV